MKKITALLLFLVLALSLAACGGEETPETTAAVPETTAAPETAVPETTATPETTEPGNSFDTSWANNEFEALLPQLPFTGWTTELSGSTYKMELGGLDTSLPDSEDAEQTDKTRLIAYLDNLTVYGFTVEETGGIEGYPYQWDVIDPDGNKINFTCAEGYCWVEITMASAGEDVSSETAAFDPHWAGEDFEMPIPPVPFTAFEVEGSDSMIQITCTDSEEMAQITEDAFNAYCDDLIAAGFANVADQSVSENYYGTPCYHFLATAENSYAVEMVLDVPDSSQDYDGRFAVLVILG